MERCFYCLDEKVSISVCLSCRTRLERAEQDMKEMKKQLELRRQAYFQKVNDYRRKIKRK